MRITLREADTYAKGGSVGKAKEVASKGRYGDSMVIHINPDEYKELVAAWGEPTFNPHTGAPEFFLSGLKKWLSKNEWVAPVASTVGAVALGPTVGSLLGGLGLSSGASSLLGNALVGGGIGALTGGSSGALQGALLGGVAAPYIGNALSGTAFGDAFGMSSQPTITSYLGSLFGANGSGAAGGAGNPLGYDPTTGKVVPVTGANTPSAEGGSGLLGALGLGGGSGSGGGSGLGSLLVPGMMGLAAMSSLGGKKQQTYDPMAGQPQNGGNPNYGSHLKPVAFERKNLSGDIPTADYYTYGERPGKKEFFTNNQLPTVQPYAEGGGVDAGGAHPFVGHVLSGSGGRSDNVSALLSKGEYVFDSETVSLLGDGDNDAGAERLDQMREAIRQQKGQALAKGKISPDALPPLEYLGVN